MRIELNFASREYVLLRKVYVSLAAGLLVCLALFGFLYAAHGLDIERSERLRAIVQSREAELEKSESVLRKYTKELDKSKVSSTYTESEFANAAIKRRTFSWTTFLGRIEGLVPKGVGITGIRPDFGTLNVDISGTATDMGALTEFLERLTRSEYFSDIPPTFSTSEENLGPGFMGSIQRFNFKIQYIPFPAKAPAATPEQEGG
jgi:hypothetical protein